MANQTVSFKFIRTLPSCYSNEIWHKMGYNSASAKDTCEIFASMGGFQRRTIEYCQQNFTPTNPCCHGNEIWDKKAIIRIL